MFFSCSTRDHFSFTSCIKQNKTKKKKYKFSSFISLFCVLIVFWLVVLVVSWFNVIFDNDYHKITKYLQKAKPEIYIYIYKEDTNLLIIRFNHHAKQTLKIQVINTLNKERGEEEEKKKVNNISSTKLRKIIIIIIKIIMINRLVLCC